MKLYALRELDRTDGTVQLRQHVVSDAASTDELVLVPRPSSTDPNDPLRWPAYKKNIAFFSICAFTFLANYGIAGLAPAFYDLSKEFDRSQADISGLLLWPILVLGVFNFLWVPIANYTGKRPVFVFSSALLCASFIWGACATSFQSLLWSNVIAAFAGSTTEALGASIVNDLFFLHERGAKMGLYMNFITGGNTVGPLICGFIVTSLSWRWHKGIAVIFTALNFVAVLLFVPETRYQRDADQNVGLPDFAAPVATDTRANSSEKQPATVVASNIASPSSASLAAVPKKTWLQETRIWSGVTPDSNLFIMFVRPLPMFAYPCVIFSFLSYAVSLVITVAVNILNPFVLQAPPYNWSPSVNGLINLPGLIGNVVGSFAGGWLVDKFCDWRLRKTGGVFEPESRLYLLVLPIVTTVSGCVLFGYAVQETLQWTSLFFGYGMISIALTAVPTITMTYVSDCLLPVNADALMLVNGSKNIVAFGFLYGIVPWVEQVGYVDCFGTLAGIFVAIVGVGGALLIVFGGKIRHKQAHWRIIL